MADLTAIHNVMQELEKIFNKYSDIDKVVLFGSRARGDYKSTSDIDLCIFGNSLSKRDRYSILDDIDEIETFYSFDVVFFDELDEEPIKESVLRDMKKIYGR